jgi:3-hydroxymyristoyl/3-hydroxydecanoyl-(acyl carrier protein) dehydratase
MRFLFVDQILKAEHSRKIFGVKHITPEDFFLCHQPGDDRLCFIPSLIGETIGQLAAWQVMKEKNFELRPVAGVVAEAIMHRPAYVGDTLFIECDIVALDDVAVEYHGHARVNGELVFSVVGAIGPMLPMTQFISHAAVQQQFDEIYRPIDGSLEEYLQQWPASLDMPNQGQVYPMQFDVISDIKPKESCRAFKKITRAAPYFPDHFPNKPVLPLTVLLECKRQLAQTFLEHSGWTQPFHLKKMERIKMSDFVQPGEVIASELIVKRATDTELVIHIRSYLGQKRVCVVDLVYQAEE